MTTSELHELLELLLRPGISVKDFDIFLPFIFFSLAFSGRISSSSSDMLPDSFSGAFRIASRTVPKPPEIVKVISNEFTLTYLRQAFSRRVDFSH